MPFEIVRNDITKMKADAIVNTANPKPVIGSGVDAAIHRAAGPRLLMARLKIGRIAVGEAVVTPAFGLDAKYVIHAVGPIWHDDQQRAPDDLRRCYDNALNAALEHDCRSVAFPLMATGNYEFPLELAFEIALQAFKAFLEKHEMQIYLVVFGRDAVALAEQAAGPIQSYMDDTSVDQKLRKEYGIVNGTPFIGISQFRKRENESSSSE